MTMRRTYRDSNASGVALLAALGFLFLFAVLGVAYADYMMTVWSRTQVDAGVLQSRVLARSGAQAAVGRLQDALSKNAVRSVLDGGPGQIEIPVYKPDRNDPSGFSVRENQRATVKIAITDESGKINLNHATPRVLQAVLGVDGETARKIRSSTPVPANPQQGAWFTSVDDLVTRGLMSPEAFARVDKQLVTVYSVADHAEAAAFLNVNAASPAVLAAILDVTPEAAQAIAAKRPFNSMADLAAAAGKDPMTFNLRPAGDPTAGAPPVELGFESRCFRVVSEATVAEVRVDQSEGRKSDSRAEAVVVFGPNGARDITYWSENPQQASS